MLYTAVCSVLQQQHQQQQQQKQQRRSSSCGVLVQYCIAGGGENRTNERTNGTVQHRTVQYTQRIENVCVRERWGQLKKSGRVEKEARKGTVIRAAARFVPRG
jgi:fatty acid-binding protein DegV